MKLACALVLVSSVAHAEHVTAELGAGAGNDTSSPAFATADAAFGVEATRQAAPIGVRGLVLADPDSNARLWIFTGLDPVDRDGAGADVHATARAGGASNDMLLDSHAWARGAGWQAEGQVAIEPIGSLKDQFWRSGRGVTQTEAKLTIPAMWAIGQVPSWQVLIGSGSYAFGTRTSDAASDSELQVSFIRVQTPRTTIDAFGIDVFELGVAKQMIGATTYGTAVSGFDFELAHVTHQFGDVEVSARGGLALRSPLGPYQATGTSTNYSGPAAAAATYWVEAQVPKSWSVGAGNWLRIDPSGHAVDSGYLASIGFDQAFRYGTLHAEVDAGRLRRIVIGEDAPLGLAPVGTRMWMGRGSLAAEVPLSNALALTASTWVERSDRDDPRWTTPATGELATHAGAALDVRWRFQWVPKH